MQQAADSNPQTAAVPVARGRFISSARVFTAFTFVSRLVGLVRETVLANVFGQTRLMDAFTMGFRVPNLFRRLFGEGALTSALIPVLTEYESGDERQRELGLHLVQAVVTLTTCLLAVVTLLIEAWILLTWRGTVGDPRSRLVAALTALMLPYVIMVCLVAIGSAVLNVRGRFAEQASAPIILSLCNILTAAVVAPLISRTPHVQIFVLASSVLVAGVLQLALVWRALAVRGVRLRWRFSLSHPGVRKVMWLMAPMILPLSVVQINTYMDSVVAWYLTASADTSAIHVLGVTIPCVLREGSVIALSRAAMLYEMPLGVFSIALATAIFPALSRHAADRDLPGLSDTLRRGLQISLLFAIPATAGLWLLQTEVVRTILEYGRFRAGDTPPVARTMTCFVVGLAAFSIQQLLVRAFYALKQVRTPVWVSVCMVLLNLPLNLALVLTMRHPAGLALSTTICAGIQATWLGLLLRRQLGRMGGRRIVRSAVATLIATAVMSAAIVAWQWALAHFGWLTGHTLIEGMTRADALGVVGVRLVRLITPVCIGLIVFWVVARATRNEALHDLLSRET